MSVSAMHCIARPHTLSNRNAYTSQDPLDSGQIMISPQPVFFWNKGISLSQLPFWGEVRWGRYNLTSLDAMPSFAHGGYRHHKWLRVEHLKWTESNAILGILDPETGMLSRLLWLWCLCIAGSLLDPIKDLGGWCLARLQLPCEVPASSLAAEDQMPNLFARTSGQDILPHKELSMIDHDCHDSAWTQLSFRKLMLHDCYSSLLA